MNVVKLRLMNVTRNNSAKCGSDLEDKDLFVEVEAGTIMYDVVKEYYMGNMANEANEGTVNKFIPIVLGKFNNKLCELTSSIEEDGVFEVVNIANTIANKTYSRTLTFVLIKAVMDLFSDASINIEHSISKGIFGEIHKENKLTEKDVEDIKEKMQAIIERDIPINKLSLSREEAIDIFEGYGMTDKVRLLRHSNAETVKLYELDGRYDYFYGSMAYSTGAISIFDIMFYNNGFILRYPTPAEPMELPKFVEQRQLARIFSETKKWGNILDVGYVGSLNDKVDSGEINNIIRVAEALHEKKIAYIADMIYDRKDVKLVLIAGPSSSGKTTFARRLGIQLRVNGLKPVPISLDDYFVDRDNTPKDEFGEFDFESIYALDLFLFNEHLQRLLNGEEVELPVFNFKSGKREWSGEKLKIDDNSVLIIEGIHGLNEMLTHVIPKENKFKIYISALTQLNLDSHNRISTTDVRMTRRIVRDYLSRGYCAEDTLKMWPSIKRGEEKNIFIYQEEADVMFNSSMVYELCVLKKFALEELKKIPETSPVYYEALRLRSFLNFFKEVDVKMVPDNSILREFIGGSCFYKY